MTGFRSNRLRLAALALRLALGAIFLYGAYAKLREPWQLFAMSVDAYGVLPHWGVIAVARTLPWAELVIGVLLVVGWLPRLFSAAAALLLLGFFTLMVSAYLRGLQIDCGCFGGDDPISWRTLLRDGAILAAALALTAIAVRRARQAPA
jgi:uncharacterized membrane protein YphA (DoxX/SURF4 family)